MPPKKLRLSEVLKIGENGKLGLSHEAKIIDLHTGDPVAVFDFKWDPVKKMYGAGTAFLRKKKE